MSSSPPKFSKDEGMHDVLYRESAQLLITKNPSGANCRHRHESGCATTREQWRQKIASNRRKSDFGECTKQGRYSTAHSMIRKVTTMHGS